MIGAYYYPWYKGKWTWFSKIPSIKDLPILGEYNNSSLEPNGIDEVLQSHASMAKKAGIDFLIISHSGGSKPAIINCADKSNLKVTYLYESLIHSKRRIITSEQHEKILDDIEETFDEMQDPSWLHIEERPVLFIYVTRVYIEIEKFISSLRELSKKSIGKDIFIVGDELFWKDLDPERIRLFDAVTAYNMYQPGRFSEKNVNLTCDTYLDECAKMMASHAEECNKLDVPLWPVAMPGYDDRRIRPEARHFPIPRLDGEFFKKYLDQAKLFLNDKNHLCITSFCEWYEGTQIEPAKSYGDLYLNILRDFKENIRS